ncbi:MAG: prepilin-type N-terminal cleavage/methylation domain-containing protein [Chthonomonadaceae bacterium]|nr:prepilin-type N-terminal cleavage/methylation domain-containing protein [Chthonomonadaceae bacterium]
MTSKRAFTLIELLVVIAIIAILAAILFPVFAQAKLTAKKTASINNQKQYLTAMNIYTSDSDDTATPIQYNNTYDTRQGDRAIGQLVLPYMKNMDIWADPNSPASRKERLTVDLVDPDTLQPPYKQLQTEFNLAIKNDYGYNTQYFSVMGANCSGGRTFVAGGTNLTRVTDSANTIMFVNSVWDRNGDAPKGGGNWGLDMPCRFNQDGSDTLPPLHEGCTGRWWWTGWQPGRKVWNEFGGAWPYHSGKAVVGFVDSHAKVVNLSALAKGCNVQRSWGGRVFDTTAYIWDLD